MKEILASIDAQIAILRKARALLAGKSETARPPVRKKRRKLSAAARKKISEAQKKRWAATKK
jgi:hypothetical protein